MIPFLVALLAILFLVFSLKRPRSRLLLPPGPKPWPLIGNILDMPVVRPYEKYQEWCEAYGSDVIFLHLPTRPIVILGSAKAAFDLLDKRSNIYSDRVTSVLLELMEWGFNFGFMAYTPRWRAHRRMFHQYFHQGIVNKYQSAQRQQVRTFLSWILEDPANTRKHVRQLVTSIVFFVTYGKKIASMDDEYVLLAQDAVEGVGKATVAGAYWIDLLPIIKYIPSWVPGTAAKRLAEEYRPRVVSMRDKPYLEVRDAVNNGSAVPSLASSLMENNYKKYGGTEDEATFDEIAKNVSGLAYVAGADTTFSACSSFLLAMAMFPEVQKRAQAELYRVVGPSRLPDYDDISQIPYIRAMMMETMRWMPVLPFGVPHALIADDTYKSYHIRGGQWLSTAILHNEEDYPSPNAFKPERFLDEDGNMDPTVQDPTTIAFGFGRRICPGRYFSHNTLSMFIASVLHVFDITAGVDASGKPIELSMEMAGGIISMPRDVPCGLRPRSQSAVLLIKEGASEF